MRWVTTFDLYYKSFYYINILKHCSVFPNHRHNCEQIQVLFVFTQLDRDSCKQLWKTGLILNSTISVMILNKKTKKTTTFCSRLRQRSRPWWRRTPTLCSLNLTFTWSTPGREERAPSPIPAIRVPHRAWPSRRPAICRL